MKELEQIEHQGIISKIIGNEIKVSIISKASCASCKIKGSCSVSEIEEKIVDVFTDDVASYKVGETVDVYYKQSLGFRAMFLGYLLPFFVVLFTLILGLSITQNEVFSGLLAMFSLIPYYTALYLSRHKHKKTFSFSIKKKYTSFNQISFN